MRLRTGHALRWSQLGWVGAILVAVIGVTTFGWMLFGRDGDADVPHNVSIVPGLALFTEEAKGSFSGKPGTIGITAPMALEALEPISIVSATPLAQTTHVELIAARAVFSGHGTSPGGYRRAPGYPLAVCAGTEPTMPAGFGPTYPLTELRLVKGDTFNLIFYVRSASTGVATIRGVRISYRTADGALRTVTDDRAILEMRLDPTDDCDPAAGKPWTESRTDFPR